MLFLKRRYLAFPISVTKFSVESFSFQNQFDGILLLYVVFSLLAKIP